jgi:hypothetical protein
MEQCFSLTANQPQPAYKPKKQPAEQGHYLDIQNGKALGFEKTS